MARRDNRDGAPGASNDLTTERLRRHLELLGLTLTLRELDDRLAWATKERPGPTALLEHVLGLEAAHKLEQRVARRITTSGLVERKLLAAFDFDFQPKLDKAVVLELARLDFVRRHDDVVITGKSGTGKSHILKAFGLYACEQGIPTRYARCVDLLDDLHAGLADGTYARRLKAWARPALLIIDRARRPYSPPSRRLRSSPIVCRSAVAARSCATPGA
jgi:DNA replication protein DnaC